jgi:pSer/pThr/pTyr-binding forkhead associated (FHA) protein
MSRLILSIEGQNLAEYNMTKERYTIGRLPDNDVRIDNPTVSGHHSLVINILSDSFLEDLNSTNGTYVNGKLIRKHALQHGDVITIGKHQLRFVDSADGEDDDFSRTMVLAKSDLPAGDGTVPANGATRSQEHTPAATKPAPVAKIQVLTGNFTGREVALNKAMTTLGQSGVQVIAITRRADGYHAVAVENTPGRQPPKINGQPLEAQPRKLSDNDVIELLGVRMGFFAA